MSLLDTVRPRVDSTLTPLVFATERRRNQSTVTLEWSMIVSYFNHKHVDLLLQQPIDGLVIWMFMFLARYLLTSIPGLNNTSTSIPSKLLPEKKTVHAKGVVIGAKVGNAQRNAPKRRMSQKRGSRIYHSHAPRHPPTKYRHGNSKGSPRSRYNPT